MRGQVDYFVCGVERKVGVFGYKRLEAADDEIVSVGKEVFCRHYVFWFSLLRRVAECANGTFYTWWRGTGIISSKDQEQPAYIAPPETSLPTSANGNRALVLDMASSRVSSVGQVTENRTGQKSGVHSGVREFWNCRFG